MSRWFPLNVTHNIHGNQANNNTKINIGHTFKDTKVKLCHSKVVRPNKISLSYSQCFNVNSVHPFVRALFPTNPIPEVTLAGRLKFFYSNLAKLTQDLNILNIVQRFEILFSKTLCRENHPTLQFWIRNNPSLSRRNSRKCCWKVQYSLYHHAKISISATSFLYQRGMGVKDQ